MKLLFGDTFYWIALINERDIFHAAALDYSRQISAATKVITTDEVLTELLAYCAADSQLRGEAGYIVQALLRQEDIRVIPQSRAGFLAGLELYQSRPDKKYSLVDCISMQTMRREGATEVLTGDRHFEQEGFRTVFRV